MAELTLKLSANILSRLQDEAERRNQPVEAVIAAALEQFIDEADEPTKEEVAEDIKIGFRQALAGEVQPAREMLENLKKEFPIHEDNR